MDGGVQEAAPPAAARHVAGPSDGSDPPADDALGTRVRRLRQQLRLTQRALAEPRYTRGFLAAVESGARLPSDEALAYLAKRLDVNAEDLRYGRPPGIAARLAETTRAARRGLSRGEVEQAVADLTRVAESAARYRLPKLQGWALYYLADTRLHRGDIAGALAELARAEELGETVGTAARAAVRARRAHCMFQGGESARAVRLLEGELRTLRATDPPDPDAELRVMTPLLYICLELAWRDRSRRLLADGAALLPRATDQEVVAHYYTVVSQMPQYQSDRAGVEAMLGTARRLYRELGLERELGMCHWSRGYVLRRLGQLAAASDEFRQSRRILRAVGAVQDYGGATLEFAEVRRRQGALEEATALAEEAAAIFAISGYQEAIAEADRLQARIAAQTGAPARAEELFRRAVARYAQAELPQEQVTTLRELADLLLAEGRLTDAWTALREGVACAESIR